MVFCAVDVKTPPLRLLLLCLGWMEKAQYACCGNASHLPDHFLDVALSSHTHPTLLLVPKTSNEGLISITGLGGGREGNFEGRVA